jgi:ABC-2 type transport system ATP-binding protein
VQLDLMNLRKRHPNGIVALHGVDLHIGPGVMGLLGPNGAGKSTLISILATAATATSGRVLFDDGDSAFDTSTDPNRLRRALGYLPQDFGAYPNLTPIEFLTYLAALKNVATPAKRIHELLDLVNLTSASSQRIGTFSGGMRQRVGIAQALLNSPRLLIIDEPTAGLDPEERVRFRNLLADLAGDRIVILSTHIVSDVEAIANSIAILRKGMLVAHDAPENLVANMDGRVWECVVPLDQVPHFRHHHIVSNAIRRKDGVQLRLIAVERPTHNARAVPPTLEDAYLASEQPAQPLVPVC